MVARTRARSRLLASLTLLAWLGAGLVVHADLAGGESSPRVSQVERVVPDRAEREVARATRTAPTASTTPPLPGPAGPLPTPAPLPDRWARVPLVSVGRVALPRLGIDDEVRLGVEQMVIDAGPALWPGTAAFGGWGNTVVAGHRTTNTAPFRRLGEVVPGDEITLSDARGAFIYRVTSIEVVPDTALWIVDQTPGRHLTLFTCHPLGSSRQRLVVHADLDRTAAPNGATRVVASGA